MSYELNIDHNYLLRRCPCCEEGKAGIDREDEGGIRYRVMCGLCGIQTGKHLDIRDAVKTWNTRPEKQD